MQNKGRNSSSLHPAALCEAPDGTHLFPWPQSDAGMKHQPPQLLPWPPLPIHIPQSQGYGRAPWQLAEVGMIHFSLRTCATLPSSPPSDLFLCGRNGMQLCKPCPFPSREWGYGHIVGRSELLLSLLFLWSSERVGERK